MAGAYPEGGPAAFGGKRPQFGSRLLGDPARVFHHNAWDNVEWSEEQAAAAERKVQENSTQRVCPEKQGAPSWALGGPAASGLPDAPPGEAGQPRPPKAAVPA
ncbi:tRNA N(3)-methylcytidine methyltransferase METTL2B-like [Cynocephalus volans]|uniref:tRNA N(3)-methylcytidine methyltransferase METTL2B-like n=1 Tax=Cynocephalus volans TaxID=110931 RepID=UPI002FC58E10